MSPLDEQTPTRETLNTVSAALPILRELEKKVLWLSTWMIHHANYVRQNRGGLGGLKVGGHQASSASVAALMTAQYFHELQPQDRVADTPHGRFLGPVRQGFLHGNAKLVGPGGYVGEHPVAED